MNDSLKTAYLNLSQFPQVTVCDTYYDKNIGLWVIYFSIAIDNPVLITTNPTFWYCLIEDDYPIGNIGIYPCEQKGIKETFFHQARNVSVNKKWRSGKLCLNYSFDKSGKRIKKIEGFADNKKLLLYVQRAIDWVTEANQDNLIKTGEPFELPDFSVEPDETVGFVSRPEDVALFKNQKANTGILDLQPLSAYGFSIISGFSTFDLHKIVDFKPEGQSLKNPPLGIWAFLNNPPVINKWQTPANFIDLDLALMSQGISLEKIIKATLESARNNRSVNYWAFGFPIEELVGAGNKAIHWQFLKVPKLNLNPAGFRNTVRHLTTFHKNKWLKEKLSLKWVKSVNTHPEYLFSRIPESSLIGNFEFVIIGTGSLGSILAESLVRSGAMNLTVYDADIFTEGNLCRHTLKIPDIGNKKAKAIAESVKNINPFIEVNQFTDFSEKTELKLTKNTVVIDTTSEDSVLYHLESKFKTQEIEIPFFSFSFGIEGNPIFCYAANSKKFSLQGFTNLISPFLDNQEISNGPNEGVGCWSPVFPCTIFSIQNAVHACFQFLKYNLNNSLEINFTVYKNEFGENGEFLGIKKL